MTSWSKRTSASDSDAAFDEDATREPQPESASPTQLARAGQTAQPIEQAAFPGWQARLELTFRKASTRTVLERRRTFGPLAVQKPFYPEGDACHLYLLHPPGGVVGGDELTIDVNIEPGACALLTMPAAAKFYRSAGATALQRYRLHVAEGAGLEWLPPETLLFSGSRVAATADVVLAPGARYIGWEVLCLGRPASGDHYERGELDQQSSLYRQGEGGRLEPLLLDRNRWQAGSPVLTARWGLQGATVLANLQAYPFDGDMLALLRKRLPEDTDGLRTGLTLVNGVLVGRVLANGAEPALQWLRTCWQHIRPMLLRRNACAPRIWNT